MATGDFVPFESAGTKTVGAMQYAVASGTTASIKAGEPVQKLAGAAYATLASNNFPTTTLRHVGIAASNSNETTTVAGTVSVIPSLPGQFFLGNPKVAATWDTQAKYNALIGSRVLIDLTTATFTLLASDSAGNGCIIEYLDLTRYPGKICFSFSPLSYYANV